MKNLALAIFAIVISSTSFAEPTTTTNKQLTKILGDCKNRITVTDTSFTLRKKNGDTLNVSYDGLKRPNVFNYGDVAVTIMYDSENSTVVRALITNDGNVLPLPTVVKSPMKGLNNVFAKAVKEECATGATSQVLTSESLITAMDYGSGFYEDYDPYQFTTRYWHQMADDFFGDAEREFGESQKNLPMPKCTVLVSDCRQICDGVTGIGVTACTGLGAVASGFLTPAVGIAVGTGCAGVMLNEGMNCKMRCSSQTNCDIRF